jgi:hypothetical protein
MYLLLDGMGVAGSAGVPSMHDGWAGGVTDNDT